MLQGQIYEFVDRNIDNSPDEHGVYVLYRNSVLLYIGRAAGLGVTIRSRLREHKALRGDPCAQGATHYRREVTTSARTRERELLDAYERKYGCLPPGNQRHP